MRPGRGLRVVALIFFPNSTVHLSQSPVNTAGANALVLLVSGRSSCSRRMTTQLSNLQWTALELDVLRALSIQVKYLTIQQVATGWCTASDDPRASATRILDALAAADLIEEELLEVYDAPLPIRPIFQWQPGEPSPTIDSLRHVAELLASRWSDRLRPVTVYRASQSASNCFGARNTDTGRSCEWSHDLFISTVLLHYRKLSPEFGRNWIGEAALPKLGFSVRGMKDPDAFLIQYGRIERIIEIGGRYTEEHLQALHEHCAGGAARKLTEHARAGGGQQTLRLYENRHIPYEIW